MSNARTLAGLIDTNNKIQVPSGGIQFADATNANTVGNQSNLIEQDGYEEGTWTPDVYNYQGGGTTWTSVNGTYTKIGNTVRAQFRVDFGNSGTSTGNLTLGGLPFYLDNNINNLKIGDYAANNITSEGSIFADTSLRVGGSVVGDITSFCTGTVIYKIA